MTRSRAAMVATAWLGIVLLGSVLVWAVISRVGGELEQQPLADAAVSTSSTTAAPQSRHQSATTLHAEPSPHGHHGTAPGKTPTDAASTPPPTPTGSPGGEATGGGQDASEPSGPAARSDTWSGAPGTVRATCQGSDLVDWSASPDVGWKLETEHEHGGLQARFEHGDDGREVRVTATCVAGRPDFEVRDEGEDD